MKFRSKMLAMVVLLTGSSAGAWGQVVRLRPTATVEMHQDVRLGDMATVTADDPRKAEELANTVILSDVDRPPRSRPKPCSWPLWPSAVPRCWGAVFKSAVPRHVNSTSW